MHPARKWGAALFGLGALCFIGLLILQFMVPGLALPDFVGPIVVLASAITLTIGTVLFTKKLKREAAEAPDDFENGLPDRIEIYLRELRTLLAGVVFLVLLLIIGLQVAFAVGISKMRFGLWYEVGFILLSVALLWGAVVQLYRVHDEYERYKEAGIDL